MDLALITNNGLCAIKPNQTKSKNTRSSEDPKHLTLINNSG